MMEKWNNGFIAIQVIGKNHGISILVIKIYSASFTQYSNFLNIPTFQLKITVKQPVPDP
jgi:hypothetical protein